MLTNQGFDAFMAHIQTEHGLFISDPKVRYQIGYGHYVDGKYNKARDFLLHNLEHETLFGKLEADHYYTLGGINRAEGEYNQALNYYKQALEAYQFLNLADNQIKTLTAMAQVDSREGSSQSIEDARLLFPDASDIVHMEFLIIRASILWEDDVAEALRLSFRGYELAVKRGNLLERGWMSRRIAFYAALSEQWDVYSTYVAEAQIIASKLNDDRLNDEIMICYLAQILFFQGDSRAILLDLEAAKLKWKDPNFEKQIKIVLNWSRRR